MPLEYCRNTFPNALSKDGLSSVNITSQFSFMNEFMVSPAEKKTWRLLKCFPHISTKGKIPHLYSQLFSLND
jgi:hypothetical protein